MSIGTTKIKFRKRFIQKGIIFCVSTVSIFFILNLIFPLKVNVDYSQIILDKDGSVIHSFLTKDDKWRMYTELNEISPGLRKAIIYKEDKYFYWHLGINPFAICRAMINNIFYSRRTSGASTISMQVIRLLFPNERTYFNKITEMFRAVQLEMKYSKEEILQFYMNLVPYGGNIEGVKAASLLYFGRLPDKLSLAQIVALAVVPNRPVSLKPGKNNDRIFESRNKWLIKMKQSEIFPMKDIEDALKEPLEAVRMQVPRFAPHLANRLHEMYPNVPIVRSMLDKIKQESAASITYNYSKRLRKYNINNAAVIIINNKTHGIEAYVGSQDFFDNENSGQVDGVNALRSPGSALKPLIYAAAFDQGLFTPKSVIADVPVNFDGYAPQNFDEQFHGKVTVEKALSLSLNIPAVKTLNLLGLSTITDKLKQAGFEQMQANKNLGLSLALGGCGVKLIEMTSLYSSFANYGKFSPAKFLNDSTNNSSIQLISPASAFMISEILSTLTRPDLPNNFESSVHIPKVAWKTGTSYGRRDAWSIGFNTKYTIGVWVGNFSGEGVPELSGADIATPLLFEIFNSIDYSFGRDWFITPKDIDYRLVCPETGIVPNEFCKNPIIDYFIPKVSNSQRCMHLKNIFLSANEKFSYCTSCLPANGYKEKVFPNISPELISYYENEKINYIKIPLHNPECTRVFSEQAPKIISPVAEKEYLLEKGEGQIMLSCNAANEVQIVYWYINDKLYKSCKVTETVFFKPNEGPVKISCSDDMGRNTNEIIKVKYF